MGTTQQAGVEDSIDIWPQFVHLARLAVSGQTEDAAVLVQRVARRIAKSRPEVGSELTSLLQGRTTRGSVLRRSGQDVEAPPPVDRDTRLTLLTVHDRTFDSNKSPILGDDASAAAKQVVLERTSEHLLRSQGLAPSSSMLFTGPPGVGKTLTAQWLAHQLQLPLLTVDLSAIMSSFLGRTGANVRYVFDYAKRERAVLFLDELDALAKSRNDDSDIGELKRLVTVLLQQVDDWQRSGGLLIAATNHETLLDSAIWRRFDLVVPFPLPDFAMREAAIARYGAGELTPSQSVVVGTCTDGMSFSDIERMLLRSRRMAVLEETDVFSAALSLLADSIDSLTKEAKIGLALKLEQEGVSQRMCHEITGVSRDTIRTRKKRNAGWP